MQPAAYTINKFCEAHGICRATFYNWRKQNLAPAQMRVGGRVLITFEAVLAWQRRMQERTATEVEASP